MLGQRFLNTDMETEVGAPSLDGEVYMKESLWETVYCYL